MCSDLDSHRAAHACMCSASRCVVCQAMEACSDAINSTSALILQEAAYRDCKRITAKSTLASTYGLMAEDVDDMDVEEALWKSAQYAAKQSAKACMQVLG